VVEAPLFEDSARVPGADRHTRSGHVGTDAAVGGDTKLARIEAGEVLLDPAPLGVALPRLRDARATLRPTLAAHFFRRTVVPLNASWEFMPHG
jgi:hypothetical protein